MLLLACTRGSGWIVRCVGTGIECAWVQRGVMLARGHCICTRKRTSQRENSLVSS